MLRLSGFLRLTDPFIFPADTGDSKEMVECESTVLYHIEEAAKISRGCVSDLLKFAKSCIHTPEIILDPFLLAVLLSLSTISAYEQQVSS